MAAQQVCAQRSMSMELQQTLSRFSWQWERSSSRAGRQTSAQAAQSWTAPCVRFVRRCRRCIRLCTSPRFWRALAINRIQYYFGNFVRRWVICSFTALDVFVSAGCSCYFFFVPSVCDIARIPFLRSGKVISLMLFVRALASSIGLFGACLRKIRTTRAFFFSIPILVSFALIAADPVFNMWCTCDNDFDQCEVVRGFDPRLLNPVLRLQDNEQNLPRYYPPPPELHTILSGKHKWVMPPKGKSMVHNTDLPNKKPENPHPDELDHDRYKGKDKTELYVDHLLGSACTCSGRVYGVNERPSCQVYQDHGQMRSWCYVRQKSEDFCKEEKGPYEGTKFDLLLDEKNGRWWTHDICTMKHRHTGRQQPRCECSKESMVIQSNFRLSHAGESHVDRLVKKQLGNRCLKWSPYEPEWCFVGFDSACADRELYTPRKEDLWPLLKGVDEVFKALAAQEPPPLELVNVTNVNQVSQYRSFIACQDHPHSGASLMERVTKTCRLVRNTIAMALLGLIICPAPASVILYLWIKNRCGDLFIYRTEFDVTFSDSECSDDFEVEDTEDAHGRRKGKQGRRGIRSSAYGGQTTASTELSSLPTEPPIVESSDEPRHPVAMPAMEPTQTEEVAEPVPLAHPVALPVESHEESSHPIPVAKPVLRSEAPGPGGNAAGPASFGRSGP